MVGLGTYPHRGEECTRAVRCALESGYRVIDTATYYQNFSAIAKALEGHQRSCVYLISKVWHDQHTPAALDHDLVETLERLQTDYLDAYLLHWPNSRAPLEETVSTLQALQKSGRIRQVGLSNVSVHHVRRALESGMQLGCVQVEMSPKFYDEQLLALCRAHGITLQAWAPLGRGCLSGDSLLAAIGRRYGKSGAQVALRWILQHGVVPLVGSKTLEHIQDNIDVYDFALTEEEMERINVQASSGKRERYPIDEFDFSYEQCWPKI